MTVHFDEGSDIPHMPEMALLQEIAEHPNIDNLRFTLTGHTNDKGSERFNLKLSKKRTWAVIRHLLMLGIRPYNIIFSYEGESCPLVDNDDDIARSKNRRVEILITNVGSLEPNGFAGLYSEAVFNRPFEEVEPVVEQFVVDDRIPNCIRTSNGSEIFIPAMAFVDAYGRPVAGDVQLTFETYNDPFHIFLSGIGMKVDSAGRQFDLESAGMFSLQATHRNMPVEIRPDRPVTIDLVSNSMDTDFDLFLLNPENAKWQNLGDATIAPEDVALITEASGLSLAVVRYLEQTDYLAPGKADRTTLEEHFRNMEYIGNRPIASYFRFLRKENGREGPSFRRKLRKHAPFVLRMKTSLKGDKHPVIHFQIERNAFNGNNPEWSIYGSQMWEYDGPLSAAQFWKNFHRQRFNDLRLRYDAASDRATLELKNLDSIASIPVRKFAVENASLEYQKRMWGEFSPTYRKILANARERGFANKLRSYGRSLARQERKIQQDANKFDAKALRSYHRSLREAWRSVRALMQESEQMMDFTTWAAFCKERSDRLDEFYARQRNGSSVVRRLTLNRMGIYNCDRMMELKSAKQIEPRFVLSDGAKVDWVEAYLFDEKFNGVITFRSVGTPTISVAPGTLKMILVTDELGNIYRLNETEVIAMNRSNAPQRIMHVSLLDPQISSLDELRESLGFVGQ